MLHIYNLRAIFDLDIVSLNKKRRKVFNFLKKKPSSNGIIFAQETHSSKRCKKVWNNQWGRSGAIRFSHGTSRSTGVFIAFCEHLNCKILAEYAHDGGNYLIIHSLIQDMPMVLVNYYAPNAENEQVKVLIQIKNIPDNSEISQDTSVILGGDFNLFFEKSLDTDGGNPSVKTKSLSKLQEIMTENDLCDIFRIRNPQELRFTWRNKNPFKQRRLDSFLISDSLQKLVVDSKIILSVQSDHSAVVLKVSPTNEGERGRSYWKFNNSLLDDNDFIEGLRQKIQVYLSESSEASTPNAIWDYIKYRMRQFSKKFSIDKAKKRKARRLELESKVKEFGEQLTTASSDRLINDYNKCKEELDLYMTT